MYTCILCRHPKTCGSLCKVHKFYRMLCHITDAECAAFTFKFLRKGHERPIKMFCKQQLESSMIFSGVSQKLSAAVYFIYFTLRPRRLHGGLASFRKLLHLMAFVQLITFIMASKIIVCRLSFGIKTNGHLNIRLELHI